MGLCCKEQPQLRWYEWNSGHFKEIFALTSADASREDAPNKDCWKMTFTFHTDKWQVVHINLTSVHVYPYTYILQWRFCHINNNESDKTTAEQNVYAVKLTHISGQAHSTVLFTLPTKSLDS